MAPDPKIQAAAERRLSGSRGMFSAIRRRKKRPPLKSGTLSNSPRGPGYTG